MEENRITVVQALDERDLLVKKIMSKTQKAQFADIIRPKAAVTWETRMTRAAFAAEAQSALQQIQDLIGRYDRLNAAITQSNATTYLDTSRGRMTVSCAIALRNRMRGSGTYGELTDFEGRLVRRMETNYQEAQEQQRRKNEAVRKETAAQKKGASRTQIVLMKNGRAAGRSQDGAPAEKQEKSGRDPKQEKSGELMRLFDPLNLRRRAEAIAEERESLLAELETKIKISNATTFVYVDSGPANAAFPETNGAAAEEAQHCAEESS